MYAIRSYYALALRDRFDVVGVCDRDARRLADAARVAGSGVVAVRGVAELLQRARPEAVVLVVRSHQSPRLVRALARAGVGVLCEVPAAFSGPILDRMIRVV